MSPIREVIGESLNLLVVLDDFFSRLKIPRGRLHEGVDWVPLGRERLRAPKPSLNLILSPSPEHDLDFLIYSD